MAAVLSAAGAGASGQQTAGVVAQYQADGTAGTAEAANLSTGVHPYDSGTIVVQTKPGQAAEKLVSGVVQRASQLVTDGTVPGGDHLNATSGTGVVPTLPSGCNQADGLSNFPGRQ